MLSPLFGLLAQNFVELLGGWFNFMIVFAIIVVVAVGFMLTRFYRKIEQGTALIRTGVGGIQVYINGCLVFPILHRAELMDISVKRLEIFRHGSEGLVCKDNVRADIRVAFFVRVNKEKQDVLQVAQTIGARRASQQSALVELFDAKFSEALKTVGKHFDFVELYTSRDDFRDQIVKMIGRHLNGYYLEDVAIDYLEQTPVDQLDARNILDSEGIKKITDLTARQQVLANEIDRDKEKTIKKQDVEAKEAILELERQQADAEQKQYREIATITAREQAEAQKVREEERLKAERARIASDEEIAVAEENRMRQIIVAQKNKERTDQVETERVERDRQLESVDRNRVVSLADIDKEKALEVERRSIQEVIRERVMVERSVVEEQEKIKDTHEVATANRSKTVAITAAEQEAQERLVKEIKAAEAARDAAKFSAEERVIAAEAAREASEKESAAKKILAEGITAEEAALGTAEANVIERKAIAEARGTEAQAIALEKEGTAEASVIEAKAVAAAKGEEAHATAVEKQGTAEATVARLKYEAEADGITGKAEAMKLFNEAGKEHEEFKLRLDKDKAIDLAAIDAQKQIAEEQAMALGKALETARIDIVGGDGDFFDQVTSAIGSGKTMDRWVNNSGVLTDVKNTFFNGDGDYFRSQLKEFIEQFNIGSDDVKNLSIAALLSKMMGLTDDAAKLGQLEGLMTLVKTLGLGGSPAASLLSKSTGAKS